MKKLLFSLGSVAAIAAPIVGVVSCGPGDTTKGPNKSANFIQQSSYQDAFLKLKSGSADIVPIYTDARHDAKIKGGDDMRPWVFKNTEIIGVSSAMKNDGIEIAGKYSEKINHLMAKVFKTLINKEVVDSKTKKKVKVNASIFKVYSHTDYSTNKDGTQDAAILPAGFKGINNTFGAIDKLPSKITILFVPSKDAETAEATVKPLADKIKTLLNTMDGGKDVEKVTITVAKDYEAAGQKIKTGNADLAFLPSGTFADIYSSTGNTVHAIAQAVRNSLTWDETNKQGVANTPVTDAASMNKLVTAANKIKSASEIQNPKGIAGYYRSAFVAKKGAKVNGVLLKTLFSNPTQAAWDKVKADIKIAHGGPTSGASYEYPEKLLKMLFGDFGFNSYDTFFNL